MEETYVKKGLMTFLWLFLWFCRESGAASSVAHSYTSNHPVCRRIPSQKDLIAITENVTPNNHTFEHQIINQVVPMKDYTPGQVTLGKAHGVT